MFLGMLHYYARLIHCGAMRIEFKGTNCEPKDEKNAALLAPGSSHGQLAKALNDSNNASLLKSDLRVEGYQRDFA